MKKILCVILAAMMLCAVSACEKNGDIDDYIIEQGLESYVSGADGYNVPTAEGGDVLPEVFIASWNVEGIYQHAVASDISDEDAMAREQSNGIQMGSDYFARTGDEIIGAAFRVNNNATYADMQSFGIQTTSLESEYGADASIISVAISSPDGLPCTTVFLINGETLVAFGSGMNVYTYSSAESVG